MKGFRLVCILVLLFVQPSFGSEDYNQLVLETIKEMPLGGGYELTAAPVKKMRDAFTWQKDGSDELLLNPELAKPSYCTTATYMVFYKVLQKYWSLTGARPSRVTLERLKPNLEADGVRAWGRWNSNGPGFAKFLYEAKMAVNYDDINQAKPGDFLKIFWSQDVGKKEKGHTVIYLGQEVQNGVPMIKFWGSSTSTKGFGYKSITKASATRVLFTRLVTPENFENISILPEKDVFLSSMLSKISSWKQLKSVTGIE
jgi:hypothetical protein